MDDLVFTVEQAASAGVTPRQIAVRVRRGQWQRVFPRVYAATAGPLPDEVRYAAALLYAGKPAALSHLTAARLHGLGPPEHDAVHVLLPHHRRIAAQPGLVVHRTRSLERSDVRVRHGLRVTSVDRTVVDCALLLGRNSTTRAPAAAAIQQRRTAPAQLAATAERLGATRVPWIRDLLGDVTGGSQSELELRFLDLCRRHGLPVPARQDRVGDHHVDARIGPLLIELDGRSFHSSAEEWERDLRRQNVLVRGGRTVLRFTWRMVTSEPELVAATIRAALWGSPAPVSVAGDPQRSAG